MKGGEELGPLRPVKSQADGSGLSSQLVGFVPFLPLFPLFVLMSPFVLNILLSGGLIPPPLPTLA